MSEDQDNDAKKFKKVAGFLGVPTILLQLYGPQISEFMSGYVDLAPLLGGGAAAYALHHVATKTLPDWLPTVRLARNDALFRSLRKIINNGGKTLRKLEVAAHSAEFRRLTTRGSISWPDDHDGSKDVYYEKIGNRYFFHDGTLFILQIVSETEAVLKALSFQYAPIKNLLQQAHELGMKDTNGKTTRVGRPMDGTHTIWVDDLPTVRVWEFSQKAMRPIETVDIEEETKAKLLDDIMNYLDLGTRAWYGARGIPYRRGYMFCGPPGTGKSSLALAIAGHFGLTLCYLSLVDASMDDYKLATVVGGLPNNCVLLLEDIDSAGLGREVASTSEAYQTKSQNLAQVNMYNRVSLSGMLNALDGVAAPEGHILIMSSNAPDALDPALMRAGRVDYRVEFKNASPKMAEDIFNRMMAGTEAKDLLSSAATFASRIPDGILSPAAIQGYLLEHKGKPEAALRGVEKWVADFLEEQESKKLSRKRKRESTAEDSDRVLRNRKASD